MCLEMSIPIISSFKITASRALFLNTILFIPIQTRIHQREKEKYIIYLLPVSCRSSRDPQGCRCRKGRARSGCMAWDSSPKPSLSLFNRCATSTLTGFIPGKSALNMKARASSNARTFFFLGKESVWAFLCAWWYIIYVYYTRVGKCF